MDPAQPDPATTAALPETAPRPDYAGCGIVNLVSSLVAGLGGSARHPECTALGSAEVAAYRNVVLLLIDGLGYEFLRQQPSNIIADGIRARLTSVFPSTTASAITSYLTGMTPYEHGLTGWFTYLRELGSVATVLPFRPRHGGPTYSAMGIDPGRIFEWPNVFAQMQAQCAVVTPHHLAESDYTRATSGPAKRFPYRDLHGYFAAIRAALQMPAQRRYVYAYWPELDSLCHRYGTQSETVSAHFEDLCAGLKQLLSDAKVQDTLILLCADHGHIDTPSDHTVALEQHPELVQCLAQPLCGEPRAAFCYVHSDAGSHFEHYIRNELAEQCVLLSRLQLLDSGLLGTGTAHTQVRQRIGDYLLLMRDAWVVRDRLANEDRLVQVGVHGGLSTQEMYVPLARFDL